MQGVLDFRFLSRYIHLPEKVYSIRHLLWILVILVCIVIGVSSATEQYHIAFGLFAVLLGIGIFLIPYSGILLFIALTYTRPQDHIKSLAGMPVILVVMSLTFGCWLLRLLLFRKREFVKTPHNLFLLGLVLTAMLSCVPIWLATAKDAFMDFFKILLAFFLMVNLIDTRRKLDIAVWVVLVGTVYIAALGILQYYGVAPEITGTILEENGGLRIQGFGIFNNPNYLAYGVLMAIPIAIYAAYYSRFWLGKSLFLLILAVLLYCVYLTGSRGGLLSTVLTILFCILQDRKPRTILIGAFFGIAILLIMLKSVPGLETVRYYRDDGSAMGRVDSWKAGFDMLSASPLLGVGYKQYIDHWYLDSHNAFIEVGSELGFIGLFIWVGLFYWSYKYLRAAIQSSTGIGHRWQKAHNKSLKAILFAFAVGSCFASLSYYLLVYIFHSLAVVAGRLYTSEEKRKEISQIRLKDLLSIGGIGVAVLCTWYVFPRL